jgi:hypothetical protein
MCHPGFLGYKQSGQKKVFGNMTTNARKRTVLSVEMLGLYFFSQIRISASFASGLVYSPCDDWIVNVVSAI